MKTDITKWTIRELFMAARRTPGERRIPRTHVAALICSLFCLFALAGPVGAQVRLVWSETFDSEEAKKLAGEDEVGVATVSEGIYRIKIRKSQDGYVQNEQGFDRGRDFRVETRVRQSSLDPSCYAGLSWDMGDFDNCSLFVLAANGNFAIMNFQRGSRTLLVAWQPHASVRNQGYNTLSVERRGNLLIFGINGSEVSHLSNYANQGGKIVAVQYGGEQEVGIDYIAAYAEKPFVGDGIEPAPGSVARFDARLDKSSGSWLMGAAPPLGAVWEPAETSLGGPSSEGYTLQQEKRGTLGSVFKTFDFSLARDFAILARMRLESGDTNYGYGLALDCSKDGFLQFAISGDGSFTIKRNSAAGSSTIVPWTKSANVEVRESENTLGVFRRKDKLLFAINGRKVHEMPYEEWLSTALGFCQAGAMRVRPLALRILEEPAKPGIALGTCESGFGIRDYQDGSRYVGYWSGGKAHGAGTRYFADGRMLDGTWIEGDYSGPLRPADPPYFYPVVDAMGDYGLVDASGKVLGFGLKNLIFTDEPLESMQLVAPDRSLGFIDRSGGRHVSTEWKLASGFREGYAVAKTSQGAYGIMDGTGAMVIAPGSFIFNPAWTFQGGVIRFQAPADTGAADKKPASRDPLYGLLSSGGSVLRKADLLKINAFSQGLAAAKAKNGLYGYLDKSGAWRIPPRYKTAGDFAEGLALCSMDGRRFYIDSLGREVFALDPGQDSLSSMGFSEGLVAVRHRDENEEDYLDFLDAEGRLAFRLKGDDCLPFSEGLAAFDDGLGRWGFVDRTGAVVIAPAFKSAGSFSQGLACARKDGLWGYIDRSGAWAVEPSFASASDFRPEGLAQVKTRGDWKTWIRPTGEMLWKEEARDVLAFREEFTDNSRTWPVGKNASMEAYVQKGYYLLFTNTDAGDFSGLRLPVERGKDHAIVALMRYNTKSNTESVGLIWDLKDAANFLFLAISPQGGYGIFRAKEGVVVALSDWAVEPAVNKGINDNLVEVRREGGDMVFYINGVQVKILPWETMQGEAIGFLCMGKTSLVVESLAVWENGK